MKEYCGANPHFLTPVDDLSAAVVDMATDSSKWVANRTVAISGTVSGAVIGGGNALTDFGRKIGSWLGLVRSDATGTTDKENRE